MLSAAFIILIAQGVPAAWVQLQRQGVTEVGLLFILHL